MIIIIVVVDVMQQKISFLFSFKIIWFACSVLDWLAENILMISPAIQICMFYELWVSSAV